MSRAEIVADRLEPARTVLATNRGLTCALGAVLVVVATFFPWTATPTGTAWTGVQNPGGLVSLLAGLLTLGHLLFRGFNAHAFSVAGVICLFVAFFSVTVLPVSSVGGTGEATEAIPLTPESGTYLLVIGSLLIVGSVVVPQIRAVVAEYARL